MSISRADISAAAYGLVNTKALPSGLRAVIELANQARAYHRCKPYPYWHFRQWSESDRGPLPRCLTLPKRIVNRGAKWIFGKPIQLQCPNNPKLLQVLTDAWTANKMNARLPAIAKDAALDGGVVLKFSVDETQGKKALSFQTLSPVSEVRLFHHPHDCNLLLMARIQYLYFDPEKNQSFYYREEWTDDEEVHYLPVALSDMDAAKKSPDDFDWEISSRKVNPFGLIPLHLAKNYETNDVWGAGDLWSLEEGDGTFRVIDRINLTYHYMDRSNQYDSHVNPYIIDGQPADEEGSSRALRPGESVHIESSGSDTGDASAQAHIVFPPGGNALRPAMMEYAKDLTQQVLDACSSVEFDEEDVTHKGALTVAVLAQLYEAELARAALKRESLGTNGIAAFLSLAARGAQNCGMLLEVNDDPASYDVQIAWRDFIEPGDDEKQARLARTDSEVNLGYLSKKRAIKRIAHMEGIQDVEELEKEIAAEPPPVQAGDLAGQDLRVPASAAAASQSA